MNCESCEVPKNSLIAATTGRMLISVCGRDGLDVLGGHALPDHPLHAGQAQADLVLDELPDAPDPAVAEVVDVVDLVALLARVQLHQVLDGLQHVLEGEDALERGSVLVLLVAVGLGVDPPPPLLPGGLVGVVRLLQQVVLRLELAGGDRRGLLELLPELVPAHLGQVVPLGVEEQVLQQGLRGLGRRRLARAELPVDVLEGLFLGLEVVLVQGGLDGRGPLEQLEDLLLGPGRGP